MLSISTKTCEISSWKNFAAKFVRATLDLVVCILVSCLVNQMSSSTKL